MAWSEIQTKRKLCLTSRQKRQNLQNPALALWYNDTDIRMTTCDKIPGVHVDENLMWNNQFQHVSRKHSSYLWLLSKIRSYLSTDHRLLFYKAYIKPHLEYCSVVWCNTCTSNSNINKINTLQRRACKLIMLPEYNGLQGALKQLNILSFDQIVCLNKAKIMYKVCYNIALSYLQELFQMRDINLNNTASNLRSVRQKNYILSQAKCNLFKGSLTFSGIVMWNSIPLSIKPHYHWTFLVKRCSSWIND